MTRRFGNAKPFLVTQALFNGGNEQRPLQLFAPFEQHELPVIGKNKQNLAVGKKKVIFPGLPASDHGCNAGTDE